MREVWCLILLLFLVTACTDDVVVGGTTILRACNVHHYLDYTAEHGSASVYLNDSVNMSYSENLLC